MTDKPICKSDLLLAGWHEVYYDGYSGWHHPRFPLEGGFTLAEAKNAQKKYGVDKMGELNVTQQDQ